MSCVHYKFSSKLDYHTVPFDGLHITLKELRKQIMSREHLKATKGDLQITNEQTGEEYTDDEAQIPKHSSVIVRRTPLGGVKPAGRTFIVDRSSTAVVASSRPTDSSPSMSLAQLAKTANLVDANASEDDKIKAMMSQSNHEYDPIHYSKKAVGPPPAHYVCYRCGKPGHYIRQCPMLLVQDKSVEGPKPVRISKGIPQSFMVIAEPGTKGAMLTSTGEYAIPAIDAKAYAKGKKERPPFVPHDQSPSEVDAEPIPDELLCPICNDLMRDAVVIPCCGNSFCDDCIRTALLDSKEHICFTCRQSDVSPDNLVINRGIRKAVSKISCGLGYSQHLCKQVQQAALPPPRLQMFRPLHSRQQDPLLANVTHPPPAIVPTAAPQTQVQPPAPSPPAPVSTAATATATAAAPTPPHAVAVEDQDVSPAPAPVADQHSPMHSTSQGEPPPPGEMNHKPTVRRSPENNPEIGPHGYHLSVLGLPPPIRLPHPPSGHQSRPHHPHRGGGRDWESSYTGRGDHTPAHLHIAPPHGPAPPVYPSQYLYPPPPQSYPPPYTSCFIPPPPFGYPPPPIYASGPPGRNPPWIPPGVQPPLPHLEPPLSQPPRSREYCYRQRQQQDQTTSNLNDFTIDFHGELMKYKNSPKRRRPSYSRSRSFSRSPFGRSECTRSRSRFRSRSYSYSPSRSRSRSRSHGRSFQGSPYSSHNERRCRRSRSRSHSLLRFPSPLRAGPWEGAEGQEPFRSRSGSPGGFWNCSPGGRKPPPREPPPYRFKGPSPGGHDRWERERHRQWEKEYTDWYNKHYKDYDNQQPSLHHRGRGSRDRKRDRMSPLPRDYSPQGRGRRGREERGAPPHHPPSSSSSGTKSSTKVLKTKKAKKKRPGEEPETSHYSADRGDATPVRDEPMDEITSINKTPPSSSKPASGSGVAKVPTSKSPAAPAKPSNKTVSKTQSDKTRKEKAQKVKPKVKTEAVKTEAVKTEAVKAKNDKVKKKTTEVVVIKKKDSSSSSVAKPVKTIKANPEDNINSSKSSSVRPPLLKTPPLSSGILPLPHPSLHDGPRLSHDIQGGRDLPTGSGLLPISHPHGLPLHHGPPSPLDGRRRMGDEGRSLLGPPPGKLRRIDGLGGCSDVLSHSHMSHQPPLHRLQLPSDRLGLLPHPENSEMIQGDADGGTIRPLMDLPVGRRMIKLNRDLGRKGSTETSASDRAPSGPEKISSTSDQSASSSVSEGDRSNSTTEGAGRKERSASGERRASRERPGSAGERLPGSDREQDRVSGPDRDRDRVSGSDRDRGVGSERERERDQVSGSSSQKAAATAERDGDSESSRSTQETKRSSVKDQKSESCEATSDKPTKSKMVREEERGLKDEGRSAAREEGRGVTVKEERSEEGRGGGGREESRGPEPRRQRLCSDLGRETDEAAFVPDYSEGEGSEPERGRSSPSQSVSQASRSGSQSNPSDSGTTTTADKKKKKHKKQKK
ncbi:E3 ubiquitin-protein ligase RBBP6-like, partial [Limanda limanda]|uniref:E3 ubiquitin-protein ligase RBBP6-like n=1 Tax=Limanda limanda TaxID=27771 RepID=UPI0029C979B7